MTAAVRLGTPCGGTTGCVEFGIILMFTMLHGESPPVISDFISSINFISDFCFWLQIRHPSSPLRVKRRAAQGEEATFMPSEDEAYDFRL